MNSIFRMFMKSWILWVSCKVNMKHLLCKGPEVFMIPWTFQKLNSLLKYTNKIFHLVRNNDMGESFQDYTWIQDFEADFPEKVSLKMLN